MTKSNKMEQIALMFFNKLGERFWIVTPENEMLQYVFTDEGLFPIKDGKVGINDHHMLLKLLTGKVDFFSKDN